MRKIQGVTFDLWDTLIQEVPGGTAKVSDLRVERITQVLNEGGHRFSGEEVREAYDKTGTFLEFTWAKTRDMPVRDHILFLLNCIECRLASRLSEKEFSDIEKVYSECLLERPPLLLPGAKEALEAVHEQGYRIGLISNTGKTPGSALRVIMKNLRILEYFDTATFSNEILARKPAEIAFRVTLENLRCLPRSAVHIGDDPDKDVEGALSAGMHAIQVVRDGAVRAESASAYISHMDELPEALERL